MVKIRILDSISLLNNVYGDDNGDLFLDLPPDTYITETKVPIELNIDYRLTFDFVYSVDLLDTPLTRALFNKFYDTNIIDNTFEPLRCVIYNEPYMWNGVELTITNINDKYSASFRLERTKWAVDSADLKLNELELGLFTFTVGNVLTANDVMGYVDDATTVKFPFADYNYTKSGNKLNVPSNSLLFALAMVRPYYFVLPILREGFKQLGYGFSSPFFESEFGRRLLVYLLDKSFGERAKKTLNARAEVQIPYTIIDGDGTPIYSILRYDSKIFDIGNNFKILNNKIREYSGIGEVDITGRILLDIDQSTYRTLQVDVGILHPDSNFTNNQVSMEVLATTSTDGNELDWEFNIPNVILDENDEVIVLLTSTAKFNGYKDITVEVLAGTYFEATGVRRYIDNGYTNSLGEMIDSEYTFLEFLKGLTDLFNLKWVEKDNTVTAYTPYDTVFDGDLIEGYYRDVTNDLIGLKDPKSVNIQQPELDDPRYFNKKFKDSSDIGITEKEYSSSLWSYTHDLGDSYKNDEETELSNKFFEPTDNRVNYLMCPFIKGSELRNSYNVSPRILLDFGNRVQNLNGIYPYLKYGNIDGAGSAFIPTAVQISTIPISVDHNDNSTFITDTNNIIYGLNKEKGSFDEPTLYDKVYRRWVVESFANQIIKYNIHITDSQMAQLSLRDRVVLMHGGKPLKARLVEISEHRYHKDEPTAFVMVPDKQLSSYCDLLGATPTDECVNNPLVTFTEVPTDFWWTCYVFSLVGTSTDAITNVDYYYSTDGGDTWTLLPQTTAFISELCQIQEDFLVYADVTYENCPNVDTPWLSIIPCPEYEFFMECSFELWWDDVGNQNISVVRNEILVNPPDIEFFVNSHRYSYVAGPLFDWQDYDDDNPPEYFGEEIYWTANINVGTCPAFDIGHSCIQGRFNPIPTDCSKVRYSIRFVETTAGCYKIEETIDVPVQLEGLYDTIIKYRIFVEGDWSEWSIYDPNSEICASKIQARGFMDFCDDVCPRKCTSIKEQVSEECDWIPIETRNVSLCN